MLVPSRNVIPSWTPRSWPRSSSRSHTPRWAQRMNICAARDQGPSSAGMARHLAPFSWRQRMAEMVRRRSFGCVLPLGRHASTNGSKFVHCASDTIALSSFQKEQNARHHKQVKGEQALKLDGAKQQNLIITRENEPEITVDNIEVAQFIYLLLHNQKIRDVIDTITSKAVLILGSFTERKAVLDTLRDELRKRDRTPIIFDFERPGAKNVTDTVKLLA